MNKKRKIVVNEDLFLDVLKNRVDGLIDFHFFRSLEKQDLLKEFKMRVDFLKEWIERTEHLVKDNDEYRKEKAFNDQIDKSA